MLDETEFAEVSSLYRAAFRSEKPKGLSLEALFAPVSQAYERLTGYAGRQPNAVIHHRIAQYGPPSTACGNPLRTPEARYCAACGKVRHEQGDSSR
ncbi:hypothetical protein COCOR_02513 [Corallococcus coralloides DSM 2259]|uniref:Uncharacterized protein n=1 Tax=Corallococcus coralloides (strain ATCC 25202 / DSM 2259 / NBRC 100086 / M2) TaxID=1144275 RepID=H8MQW2_CORCM|nr:hypothetical protein [Corallococcus coralloides]AFE04691.1 hypothetical protein COCOR_02513 [Corallococcus coralloides DSM 2259]